MTPRRIAFVARINARCYAAVYVLTAIASTIACAIIVFYFGS